MKTINAESINFDNMEYKNKTENYPNSGFFIAKVEKGDCDLVFIDKKQEYTMYICPEEIFYSIKKLKPSDELIQEKIKYEGDFILEFARILLNRK